MIERNVLELLNDIEEESAAAPRPGDIALPPDADVRQPLDNLRCDILACDGEPLLNNAAAI